MASTSAARREELQCCWLQQSQKQHEVISAYRLFQEAGPRRQCCFEIRPDEEQTRRRTSWLLVQPPKPVLRHRLRGISWQNLIAETPLMKQPLPPPLVE
jgi:hypothetical protein